MIKNRRSRFKYFDWQVKIYTSPSCINSSSGVQNKFLPTNIGFVHIIFRMFISYCFLIISEIVPSSSFNFLFQNHNLYNCHHSTIMCILPKRTWTILRSSRSFNEVSVFVEVVKQILIIKVEGAILFNYHVIQHNTGSDELIFFSGFAVMGLRKSLNLSANMPKEKLIQPVGKGRFFIFFLSIIFITQHL
jgi:hypothetical protein